jgi:hypothetical protein
MGSPTSPSTLGTDNMYCVMMVLPSDGRALPASHPHYERASPRLTQCEEPVGNLRIPHPLSQ